MPQTGPVTTEGKARVSRNAVKHGLRSMAMVIPGLEDEQDWRTFYDDMVRDYAPSGALECVLVDRAAGLAWRLRRAARAERDAALRGPEPDKEASEELLAWQAIARTNAESAWMVNHDYTSADPPDDLVTPPEIPHRRPRTLPDAAVLLTISKYEARLHRQFMQVIHELEARKERRAGRAAPLARIDITTQDNDDL